MARYHPPISFTACIVPFQVGDATTPRVPLETTENQLSFTLRRVQFLIRLCFAMTINKSQGQLLTQVGVDLRVPAFSHGQLYAALSRVTNVAKQKRTFNYPTLARPSLLSRKIDLYPILLLPAERDAFFSMLKSILSFRPDSRSSAKEVLASEWMVKWALPEYEKVRQSYPFDNITLFNHSRLIPRLNSCNDGKGTRCKHSSVKSSLLTERIIMMP